MKKVLAFMLTLALILSCTAALAADAVTLTYSEVNPWIRSSARPLSSSKKKWKS